MPAHKTPYAEFSPEMYVLNRENNRQHAFQTTKVCQTPSEIPVQPHQDGRDKSQKITSVDKDLENLESSYTADGNIKWDIGTVVP